SDSRSQWRRKGRHYLEQLDDGSEGGLADEWNKCFRQRSASHQLQLESFRCRRSQQRRQSGSALVQLVNRSDCRVAHVGNKSNKWRKSIYRLELAIEMHQRY